MNLTSVCLCLLFKALQVCCVPPLNLIKLVVFCSTVTLEDYEYISSVIYFTDNLVATIPVYILDDFAVDEIKEEYFTVVMARIAGQPMRIFPDFNSVNITIIDDDSM